MEKTNLRKVTFFLNGANVLGFQHLSLGDAEEGGEDYHELTKRRRGQFHCWGNGLHFGEDGQVFPMTFAIIEMSDGKIVKIPPQNVKFIKDKTQK